MRSVLLITFTDKAAGELTERVRRAFLDAGRPELAREVDNAWISTIHGFCSRIVRRHALELGVDPAFEVLVDPFAGLARTESFERAAQRCLQTSTHSDVIAELIDDGVADLRKAVFDAYDRSRSKGVSVEDTRPSVDAGYHKALTRLAEALDESLPRYRQLRETATVAANLAGYVELRAAISRVQGIACAAEGVRATFALGAHRGACRGDEETKSLTRGINEALEAAVQAAIDSLAAERAAAWRELLIEFASEYGQLKTREEVLDFEDLQLLTRRLWTERPDIAQRLGDRFAEVMVDEFQDTNVLQLQVIEPISHRGQCVVGDAQQSIYGFRDADVTVLEGKRRRAEAEASQQACRLTVNYRSDCRLLDALNTVFGAPAFFGDDYLRLDACAEPDAQDPWPKDAPRVQALIIDKTLCPDKDWRRVEARALADRLRTVVDHGHATADDIVVLLRASTTMPVYVDALRNVGFDVVAASSGGFYATCEYADVRALLRVLANPLDDEGVLALLAGGFGGLSDDALLVLASAGGSGLWAALGDAGQAALPEPDRRRAASVHSTIERVREARGRIRLADAVLHAAAALGREGGLLARPESWANVRKAARLASEFERTGASDPAAFLRYLDDRETFVRREPAAALAVEGSGAVRVMTVHAAKGLEFPVVAVGDLGHGSVNTHNAFLLTIDGDGLSAVARGQKTIDGAKAGPATPWTAAVAEEAALDLAESKRVFYVACTRAERALVLAGSTDPAAPPREEIAADWILEAARSGGEALGGLMAVDILGADDVPLMPARVHGGAGHVVERPDSAAPTLPEAGPIPPPQEVSYTALSLYERCAYRFFAERMLRVGSLELPEEDDPRALGVALHAALELVARGQAVDGERLLRVAASNHLTGDSARRLQAALDAVRASRIWPLIESGAPEFPFAIRVEGGVVRGSMDLVARYGAEATVLDYKTGATWDATGARYEAQAEIYALALLEAGASSVHMRFVHVEAGCEEAEYRFTAADRDRVRARIERAFASMRSGAFAPLTAYDPSLCADCPVSGGLCRVVHPHAGARTRTRER
jgi:ATP-dependent exoDNAse (exonuclease V) beta subunit